MQEFPGQFPAKLICRNRFLMRMPNTLAELRGGHWSLLFLGGLIVLVSLTAVRIQRNYAEVTGEFDWDARGHCDFHNGLYLPGTAFRHGENPYETATANRYGMSRAVPPFSPSVFILNLPFTWPELPTADWLWFAFNVAMIVILGWLGIRFSDGQFTWPFFLFLACLLIASRPGHVSLFNGYFTAQLAIGTAVALHFARSRPWLAGIGLLLASGKPNFILPLLILMICRRDFRAVAWGIAIAGVFALGGLLWMAADSSLGQVIDGVREGQQALHDDPDELPQNRWTRIDVLGLGARLLRAAPGDGMSLAIMLGLLALPGLVLNRIGKSGYEYGATGVSGMIVALSILLSIHHHAYDGLLLVVPWIGITFYGSRIAPNLAEPARWSVALLTAVPAANYLSTLVFRETFNLVPAGALWQTITLLNGVCLLVALVILLLASRGDQRST